MYWRVGPVSPNKGVHANGWNQSLHSVVLILKEITYPVMYKAIASKTVVEDRQVQSVIEEVATLKRNDNCRTTIVFSNTQLQLRTNIVRNFRVVCNVGVLHSSVRLAGDDVEMWCWNLTRSRARRSATWSLHQDSWLGARIYFTVYDSLLSKNVV